MEYLKYLPLGLLAIAALLIVLGLIGIADPDALNYESLGIRGPETGIALLGLGLGTGIAVAWIKR